MSNIDHTLSYITTVDIDTFKPLSTKISSTYWGLRTQLSTSLDIISVYLKGQKLLYIEAKTYCEWYLNFLMIPAICISAVCSILSAATLQDGNIIVAGLTGLNSFIISMISYLKLDAKAETFRVTAYKFDKLQTKCEFYAGKILYAPSSGDEDVKLISDLYLFIENIEKDIHDIKEVNQFIIPETIRYRYPRLYSINIFAEIKKLRNIEIIYTQELTRIYNEISELLSSNIIERAPVTFYERRRILNDKKQALIQLITLHRDKYLEIDEELTQEVNRYILYKKYRLCSRIFGCCREPPMKYYSANKENRFHIVSNIEQVIEKTKEDETNTMSKYMEEMGNLYKENTKRREEQYKQDMNIRDDYTAKDIELRNIQHECLMKELRLKSIEYDIKLRKATSETQEKADATSEAKPMTSEEKSGESVDASPEIHDDVSESSTPPTTTSSLTSL